MSNKAITWAYAQHELRSGPKFILVTLADMADQEHSCYPGVDLLMELTGFGRTAVVNHLNALLEAGYIASERRNRKNGARTSNRYFLQLEKAPDVQPENVRTSAEPMYGFSENLSPESVEPMSGIRTAYKDEPKEEPKGEPSDNPLEGLDEVPGGVIPDAFEVFWGIYPRHEARKVAETRFRKALEHHPAAVIIDGARRYAEFCKAVGRSSEHIAHPSSWLNQERWHDELQLPAQAPMTHRRDQAVQDQIRRFQAIDAAATVEPMREIS